MIEQLREWFIAKHGVSSTSTKSIIRTLEGLLESMHSQCTGLQKKGMNVEKIISKNFASKKMVSFLLSRKQKDYDLLLEKCLISEDSIDRFREGKFPRIQTLSKDFYALSLGYLGWNGFEKKETIGDGLYIHSDDEEFLDFEIDGYFIDKKFNSDTRDKFTNEIIIDTHKEILNISKVINRYLNLLQDLNNSKEFDIKDFSKVMALDVASHEESIDLILHDSIKGTFLNFGYDECSNEADPRYFMTLSEYKKGVSLLHFRILIQGVEGVKHSSKIYSSKIKLSSVERNRELSLQFVTEHPKPMSVFARIPLNQEESKLKRIKYDSNTEIMEPAQSFDAVYFMIKVSDEVLKDKDIKKQVLGRHLNKEEFLNRLKFLKIDIDLKEVIAEIDFYGHPEFRS